MAGRGVGSWLSTAKHYRPGLADRLIGVYREFQVFHDKKFTTPSLTASLDKCDFSSIQWANGPNGLWRRCGLFRCWLYFSRMT